ncbi:hypothetical protein F2N20_11230 [Escherichia coli]|nr:hypothetical protein [Escherichia coli]
MSPHRHDCRVSQVISRRSEAPSAVRVFGDFPAVDLSDGGRSPRHGAVVRGRTQKFCKRKLTAVCSHQTRIGNLDAHLI